MTEDVLSGKEYLGRGWAFPVRWSASGAVGLTAAEANVRQAILLILRTAIGERIMHPDFGAGIDGYVFAPRSAETCFRLQSDVERALLRWELRAIVEQVVARPSPLDEGRIDVVIDYRIDPHRYRQTLVYPFYVADRAPEAP
jgi:uncharacterized protein